MVRVRVLPERSPEPDSAVPAAPEFRLTFDSVSFREVLCAGEFESAVLVAGEVRPDSDADSDSETVFEEEVALDSDGWLEPDV